MNYTAREEHDGSAASLLKHYVGVYDPKTGELELMEAHHVTVRSTLRSEEEEMKKERARVAQGKQANVCLVSLFGVYPHT